MGDGGADMYITDVGDGNYIHDEEYRKIVENGGPDNREPYSASRRGGPGAAAVIGGGALLSQQGCEPAGEPVEGGGGFWGWLKATVKPVVEFFDPTPVGLGISIGKDYLPAVVDPVVTDAQDKRSKAAEWWLSDAY
ncbi:MAG: hypothetical protein ABL949_05450 [Fimbriimonadaceae bacterium]